VCLRKEKDVVEQAVESLGKKVVYAMAKAGVAVVLASAATKIVDAVKDHVTVNIKFTKTQ
jgi:hypothetical protein